MAIDDARRTRRALLSAGLGAAAATVATALPVAAVNPPVLLDQDNPSTGTTSITNGTSDINTFEATNTHAGVAIKGTGTVASGVLGESASYIAIEGFGHAVDQPAVLGWSDGNSTGIQGFSGSTAPPAASAKTGVYGYAAQDASARGVTGQSTAGYGLNGIASTGRAVNGTATTGYGVFGAATSGIGARGWSTTGTALYASTSGPKVGTALRAIGRVTFDNCAGVATIAAGQNSVTVTPGSDVLPASAVVATLMGSAGGTTTVHRVVINAVADTFTIFLTANATVAVTVAWHVFG